MTLLSMLASAETVVVDGIRYNLISKGNVAEVTGNSGSFSHLALPPHQMTKSAKKFLGLLDNTQENGHGFDVELSGLDVMNDAFAIIGK